METYNFDVTRNGVTVRILIEAENCKEAEIKLREFLKENISTYEFLGVFIK